MDRKYLMLIDICTEAVRLSTAIASNANYKEAIRTSSDPFVDDCYKNAEGLIRMLTEVIDRQKKTPTI